MEHRFCRVDGRPKLTLLSDEALEETLIHARHSAVKQPLTH
jgi:hypothetical protein